MIETMFSIDFQEKCDFSIWYEYAKSCVCEKVGRSLKRCKKAKSHVFMDSIFRHTQKVEIDQNLENRKELMFFNI